MSARRRRTVQGLQPWLRAVVTVTLLGYALLAMASGLDRAAIWQENRVGLRDWPFGQGMARATGADLITQQQFAAALAPLAKALAAGPLDPRVIGMMGLAQTRLGQDKAAAATFDVGGQLGWRDLPTQIFQYNMGVGYGDWDYAAQRVDALLRVDPESPLGPALLAPLLATPEGQRALVARLAERPGWSNSLVQIIPRGQPQAVAQRGAVVLAAKHGIWQCKDLVNLTNRLVEDGFAEEAGAVWAVACPAATSLLHDGNFAQLASHELDAITDSVHGLAWYVAGRGDFSVDTIDSGNGRHAAQITVQTPQPLAVLRQRLLVGPGSYRLGYTFGSQHKADLRFTLECPDGSSILFFLDTAPGKPKHGEADFDVPADCQSPILGLWLGKAEGAVLSDLSLTAVH